MGSAVSSISTRGRDTENVTSESETMNTDSGRDADNNVIVEEQFYDAASEDDARARAKEKEMNEFRKQLDIKREQRREILNRHRTEKEQLEKSLQKEVTAKLKLYEQNKELRELLIANQIEIPETLESSSDSSEVTDAINKLNEELDKMKSNNNKLRRDLVESNSALQEAYSNIADLQAQHTESMRHINALKEVVTVSKTMINLREGQLNELKNKLNEIEKSLSDREANMLSADLRQEYMRQLQNIRTLRGLYEERARLAEVTRQGLLRELEEQKALYQSELTKSKSLTSKIDDLEEKIELLQETIEDKNIEISTCKDETNKMKAEMAVVNKLFSQVLLGYKTKQDLDKLVHRLEENHGILTHMAENENDAEASSALPKLLLELVSQIDENEDTEKLQGGGEATKEETETDALPSTTPEEIVENLPKVWRVLMELLSHQTVAEDPEEKVTTCYKFVETKSGPVQVPSVSQTYIRLKDLIVEKLGLVKEVNRMKQLNSHLESRLQEQEKRLCLVTTELSKTWHVVGKLRRHHFQLHTHEKILKYELQQKRKLINEIKEELEYCREKWEQAREKNSQSEKDWRKLRAEFSSRKVGSPPFNNSGESGYSDERASDDSSESNDESEYYVAEPPTRSKKKIKKSFETIFDSSNDFNLAAEREDPVSDMLDVADLPLDTHDNNESSSEYSKSESLLKCETNLETEDELCSINHDDSCIEDHITEHQILDTEQCDGNNLQRSVGNPEASTSTSSAVQLIDPATILLNIKRQNDLLAKKDAKLESLEKNTATLLKKTEITSKISKEIESTLDHIINRPTSGTNASLIDVAEVSPSTSALHNQPININISDDNEKLVVLVAEGLRECTSKLVDDNHDAETMETTEFNAETPNVDFKEILENVRRQNERLAKKDERLNNLEKECSEVIHNISNTLDSGQEIIEKLDTLHNEQKPKNEVTETNAEILADSNTIDDNLSEPSTSNDINHVARFAARDLRLKRLEEQTKSLVKKVNKTTSKGVKINYKLEELHNIYGSENSRAGTPSEENEGSSTDENDSTKE